MSLSLQPLCAAQKPGSDFATLVRVVGPLLSWQLARDVGPAQRAACGLWSARNWIKPASASARNGLHLVSFLGLLFTWPAIAENKQKGTRSEDNQKQGRCLLDLELCGPLENIVNGDKTKSWTADLQKKTTMQNHTFNKTQSSMSESFLSNLSWMSSRSATFVSNISNMSIRNLRVRQHLRSRLRRIKRIGKL